MIRLSKEQVLQMHRDLIEATGVATGFVTRAVGFRFECSVSRL